MSELTALQAVRLKGRADATVVGRSTGLGDEPATVLLADLLERSLVKGGPSFRLTPEGRERLQELLAQERAGIDRSGLEAVYDDFHGLNDALKQVVTQWQLRSDDVPNDHTDPVYDASVVARLTDEVDPPFRALLERVLTLAPRLAPYRDRFAHAVAELQAGHAEYVARPVLDSYHTVWFELHEELIGLLGRTRADEALAGRAV